MCYVRGGAFIIEVENFRESKWHFRHKKVAAAGLACDIDISDIYAAAHICIWATIREGNMMDSHSILKKGHQS